MIKGILVWIFDQLKSMRVRTIAWILLIMLLMIAGVHYFKCRTENKQLTVPIVYKSDRLIIPEHSALRSVITLKVVQPQPLSSNLLLPAVITAIPTNVVNVYAPLAGQTDGFSKQLGETVHKGEVLYTLISPDLAQAVVEKIDAEAADRLAQQTVKRQRELMHYNIGPMHDLQAAENEAIRTKAELERTTMRLEALHVDSSEQGVFGKLVVRSPIDGIVASINAGLGSYWSDLTTPVMTVVDISQLYAMAAVQERDIAAVYLGQAVEVLLDSDGKTYPATVTFISPILDPDTRTLSVGLLLDNKAGYLKPNMFARAKFKSKPRDMIVLPLTAVIQRGFDSIVFVEVAPWQFISRVVNVGLQIGDKIEIKSGLKQNERVAITGGIILND